MRPGRAVGGVVISQRVRVDSLAVRDVIVFRDPYKPSEQVVHRIVRIAVGKSGRILINAQGDANTVRDPRTFSIHRDYAYRVRWSVPLHRTCCRRPSEPPWFLPARSWHRPDTDRCNHGPRPTLTPPTSTASYSGYVMGLR